MEFFDADQVAAILVAALNKPHGHSFESPDVIKDVTKAVIDADRELYATFKQRREAAGLN